MVDLLIHEILWCVQHGHPVLALRLSGSDRFFTVSMSSDDAAVLAPRPPHGTAAIRSRLYGLLEAAVAGLGGQTKDVQLAVGSDAILQATVRIEGPAGELTLPVHFADGIALAHSRRLPLRMAEEDIARVPSSPIGPPAPVQPASRSQIQLGPFRDVIESLDLEDFGTAGAS